ncbi:MAG: hypothetical protein Q4G42_06560 [Neisseria sp.]|nr:hypothetical protein [Neisseria sp.]
MKIALKQIFCKIQSCHNTDLMRDKGGLNAFDPKKKRPAHEQLCYTNPSVVHLVRMLFGSIGIISANAYNESIERRL